MRVVRIATDFELDRLQPQWNRLAGTVPFRMWQWLRPWWRHYGDGRELYVLAVYDDRDVLRGVAPWMLESSVREGRAVRFLGSGEVCSDHLSILVDQADSQPVTTALAQWLTQHARGRSADAADHRWDVLELAGADVQDLTIRRLIEQLGRCGNTISDRPGAAYWQIDLPASWEDYLGSVSRSHRKKLRKLERQRVRSEHIRICRANGPDEVAAGMRVLVDLHQRRRQSLGQPGCFSSPRFSGFLHEAAAALAACDRLELLWIEWQGRPIAVEFQLLDDTTVYAYQAGIAPDQLALHPGRLSCMTGIQLAIAAGQTGYDFLRGDEPYKAHWRATRRCVRDVRVVPRKPLALARHATWLAARQAKRSVKSSLAALRLRTPDESERGRAASTFLNRERVGDGDARGVQPDIGSVPTDGDP